MSDVVKINDNLSFKQLSVTDNIEQCPAPRSVFLSKEKQNWAKEMILSALKKPKTVEQDWQNPESWLGIH